MVTPEREAYVRQRMQLAYSLKNPCSVCGARESVRCPNGMNGCEECIKKAGV